MKKMLAAAFLALALAGCHSQPPPSHPLGTSSEANIPGTSGYHSP
jgi:hypothetical protein